MSTVSIVGTGSCSSNWMLSLRERVAPGSCLSVSALRFPGAIVVYDAATAACPAGS